MERRNVTVAVMTLALVALFGVFASSASAATVDDLLAQIAQLQAQLQELNGGGLPTEPTPVIPSGDLSNGISLDGLHFGYTTSTAGGKTNFDAYMSNIDRITGVGINVAMDPDNGNQGYLNAWFNGLVGQDAGPTDSQSQSMDIHRRGVEYSSNISLSSYQEVVWPYPMGAEPTYGDWMSQASANVTLFDVYPTTANANYSEWTDSDSGMVHFNAYVSWRFDFNPDASAFSTSASVPEPATMSFLGLGLLGIIVRRRRRS